MRGAPLIAVVDDDDALRHSLDDLLQAVGFRVQGFSSAEAFLQASLRAKIGPHGDLQSALREWHARHMEEHDRMLVALAANLSRREARLGR